MIRVIVATIFVLAASQTFASEQWRQVLSQMGREPVSQGQFEQLKKLKILNKPIRSSGEFVVSQQHGLLWQAQQPVSSTLVIAKSAIYQVNNGQKRLLTDNPQAAAVAQVLAQLLGGNLEQLLNNFTLKQSAKQSASPQAWQLVLEPKRADIAKLFSQIEMLGEQQLTAVKLIEPNGTISTITFSAVHHSPLTPQQIQLFNEPL